MRREEGIQERIVMVDLCQPVFRRKTKIGHFQSDIDFDRLGTTPLLCYKMQALSGPRAPRPSRGTPAHDVPIV